MPELKQWRRRGIMRLSEQKRKQHEFFGRLKKRMTEIMCHVIDVLAKPLEAFDRWQDRYERGYNDGVDAVYQGAVWVVLDMYKGRHEIIKERCDGILAVISDIELQDPRLHTEVERIEGSVQEILKQVN